MAGIAFMTKFKNGEDTDFRYKILASRLLRNPYLTDEYRSKLLGEHGLFDTGIPGIKKVYPKLHTIRESAYLQKYIGQVVTCFNWTGKAYRSPWDRFELVKLTGFEEIHIKITADGGAGITIGDIKKGHMLDVETLCHLIKNDGLNPDQFRMHFGLDSEFHGFIYHWTNLRYGN